MLDKAKIRVFCGKTIEDKTRHQMHPVNEVKAAMKIIQLNKSMDSYSNSPEFISTMMHYGLKRGVEVEFFLDGKSCGNDIEPIFADYNDSYKLLDSSL